jgi:heat shock protein HtpX
MGVSKFSLARRAIVAVLLTIGFYGLALAVVALMLFIVYAQIALDNHINIRLTLACLIVASVVLWSILPRIDRFVSPGPRLEPTENPDLFREVEDIAEKIEQRAPDDVYLISDVNAFVGERGGFMGIGRRRIMGIGLPLLQMLTINQLQAIIVHEFGHFYGGDTRLAPWVYKTRQTIVRTIVGLGGKSTWLQSLFLWYGRMFLRVTNAISRNQEFVADRLAAQLIGSHSYVEGLRTIHGVAPAFQAYLQHEVAPVVEMGFRPPLTEGFSLFLSQPGVAEVMRQSAEEEASVSRANPYDTHPPLSERIAAIETLPPGAKAGPCAPALSLVRNVPDLEQRLLAHWLGPDSAAGLTAVDWEATATQVWLPYWDKTVRPYEAGLRGVTAASLPTLLQSPGELGAQLERSAGRTLPPAEKTRGVTMLVARALVVELARQGWTLDTSPGAQALLQRGGHRIKPFLAVARLASGELTADAWQALCREAGIIDLALDAPG